MLWVRPNTNVQGMGTTISSSIGEDKRVSLRAIGAGAVNQAVKSIIAARQTLAGRGEDLIVRMGMTTVEGNDGSPITAVVFHLFLS